MITCTDSASDSRRRLRSSVWSAAASAIRCWSQPTIEATPKRALGGGLVEHLPDVPQVGEPPLALLLAEQPRDHPLARRLEQRRDPASGQQLAPLVQGHAELVERGVVVDGELLGGPAEEVGQRRRPGQPGALRLLERAEQGEPVLRRRGQEHARRAGQHHRHPRGLQGVADVAGLLVRVHQHGDVPGSDRPLGVADLQPGRAGEQPDDVGGDVAGDVRPDRVDLEERVLAGRHRLALHHPDPQRRTGPGEPAPAARRLDRVDGDPLVAERGAVEQVPQRLQQRRVAAPVGAERRAVAAGPGGPQVGDHVGAAERVDRLLGVADQHQRAVTVERALEDLPLHRVGVLELVDHHHPVAAAHPGPRRRAGRGVDQRVAQVHEQVVVVHQPPAALAVLHLAAGGLGQPPAHVGDRVPGGPDRLQPGLPVADGRVGEPGGRGQVERRSGRGRTGVHPQVEVAHHLGRHVGGGLGERQVGVDVGGDAEPGQHLQAEPVRGRDGGGVELGDRGRQPAPAYGDLGVRPGGQQHQDRVVGGARGRGVGERRRGRDEPLSHPLPELDRRRPAEGDQHQLVDARRALGDVAGRQGGDGVRLAGAGARLQHGGARGQVAARVEHRLVERAADRVVELVETIRTSPRGRGAGPTPGGPAARTGAARRRTAPPPRPAARAGPGAGRRPRPGGARRRRTRRSRGRRRGRVATRWPPSRRRRRVGSRPGGARRRGRTSSASAAAARTDPRR